MKIYAPVKDFHGLRNNVRFVNGVGESDNPAVVEWFKRNGYLVKGEPRMVTLDPLEKCEPIAEITVEKCDKDHFREVTEKVEPDFEVMTPNELRDWMRENGYGSKIKNTRNKEKLLEILRG